MIIIIIIIIIIISILSDLFVQCSLSYALYFTLLSVGIGLSCLP